MPTDIAILVVIILSALVSFVRGFFKEAVSVTTWMAAIAITLLFTNRFSSLLPRDTIESPAARLGISALALFLGTMMIGSLISWLIRKALPSTIGGPKDRLFGVFFGMLRGVIIVTLLVLAINLEPAIKQERWWIQSSLVPIFQRAAQAVHSQMPSELAQHFDFSAVRS
jgi:membrane protein required for colicin V production